MVISQSGQKAGAFVFIFADGKSWTVASEIILPAIITPFMSIEFHVDSGQVDSNYSGYGGDASFPVKLETHQDDPDQFFGQFFDGDADNDQTYTRVPIITSGRYINTSGIWQESTICYDGVPVQQFIKI